MIKGTINMMYEFISEDVNEITKVANALHEALSGNRLYIHNKIVIHWAEGGYVMVDIMDVESCYNQLPKFLESGVEFNKFVKEVIDGTCESVPVTNYLQKTIDKLREENEKLIKKNRELSAKATMAADERDHKDILCKEYEKIINDLKSQIRVLKEDAEHIQKILLRRQNSIYSFEQLKKQKEYYREKVHELFDMLLAAEFRQKQEEKEEKKDD